jgi:hypothetical protein
MTVLCAEKRKMGVAAQEEGRVANVDMARGEIIRTVGAAACETGNGPCQAQRVGTLQAPRRKSHAARTREIGIARHCGSLVRRS